MVQVHLGPPLEPLLRGNTTLVTLGSGPTCVTNWVTITHPTSPARSGAYGAVTRCLNEEYARAFPTDPPARYVAKLGVELPRVLVSIRMTAISS